MNYEKKAIPTAKTPRIAKEFHPISYFAFLRVFAVESLCICIFS
jgi:hypothetical protein